MPRVQVLLPLPSIKEPVNAYITAFAGFFHAKIARMDTLYRYWITVAKSSKSPNIGEYSNGCRLVHHQKSISKFPEKDGSVPCAVDGELAEKRNASFLFNLVVYLKPGFSEKHDEHRLKPHKMDIPRHNYLFQMRDDKSSSKSLFYGISYDIIVTFSRIQVKTDDLLDCGL